MGDEKGTDEDTALSQTAVVTSQQGTKVKTPEPASEEKKMKWVHSVRYITSITHVFWGLWSPKSVENGGKPNFENIESLNSMAFQG